MRPTRSASDRLTVVLAAAGIALCALRVGRGDYDSRGRQRTVIQPLGDRTGAAGVSSGQHGCVAAVQSSA
jgi:hypothetical protein